MKQKLTRAEYTASTRGRAYALKRDQGLKITSESKNRKDHVPHAKLLRAQKQASLMFTKAPASRADGCKQPSEAVVRSEAPVEAARGGAVVWV